MFLSDQTYEGILISVYSTIESATITKMKIIVPFSLRSWEDLPESQPFL